MNTTWLIIGIVITGLSTLAITIFSLSRFILKRIYKEEEKAKTDEQKSKDKTVKRALKSAKFILKRIYKYLLKNYLAFYGITAITFSVGAAVVTVSSEDGKVSKKINVTVYPKSGVISGEGIWAYTDSKVVNPVRAGSSFFQGLANKAMDDSSEVSSEDPSSTEPSSSEASSSESSSEVSSSEVSSSEEASTSEEVTSSEESSSSSEETTSIAPTGKTSIVTFIMEDQATPLFTVEVPKGKSVQDPGPQDLSSIKRIFKYWTDSIGGSTPYDFSAPIYQDTTIYGISNTAYYVTYIIDDGSTSFQYNYQELVEENAHAEDIKIPFPNDPDYYYVWYTHVNDDPSEDGTPYDFDASFVNDDLTLFGY